MSKYDIGWAAGFFDGEGSVRDGEKQYYLTLQQNDRVPLDRLLDILGGRVYGPYERGPGLNPYHLWRSSGKACIEVARKLEPHCTVKRDALRALLERRG